MIQVTNDYSFSRRFDAKRFSSLKACHKYCILIWGAPLKPIYWIAGGQDFGNAI